MHNSKWKDSHIGTQLGAARTIHGSMEDEPECLEFERLQTIRYILSNLTIILQDPM